jgi:hypothetical protein
MHRLLTVGMVKGKLHRVQMVAAISGQRSLIGVGLTPDRV